MSNHVIFHTNCIALVFLGRHHILEQENICLRNTQESRSERRRKRVFPRLVIRLHAALKEVGHRLQAMHLCTCSACLLRNLGTLKGIGCEENGKGKTVFDKKKINSFLISLSILS